MANPRPRVVILVPFSSKDPSRIRNWQFVQKRLERLLDLPIYVGDITPPSPGEYNASLGRNHAAQLAGDWDVAVIHDADTLVDARQIRIAIDVANKTGALVYPYTEHWELSDQGTRMLLNDPSSDWRQAPMQQYTRNQPLGACMVVRRDLWELVRGYDTAFVGWGHEDGAFAIACETLSSKLIHRVPGKSLHLRHTFSTSKNPHNALYAANKARVRHYMEASMRPNAIELLCKLRDDSMVIDIAHNIKWPNNKYSEDSILHQLATILLVDVSSVLDSYGCTHWLADNTLLRVVRKDDLATHELFLGVWAADFNPKVIDDLQKIHDCKIISLLGTPGNGMVIVLQRGSVLLSMIFYYPYKSSTTYSCLYTLVDSPGTTLQATRYIRPAPSQAPLIRKTVFGHKLWLPRNSSKYLKSIYGTNWETIDTDRTKLSDWPNIKEGDTCDIAADAQTTAQYLGVPAP